MRSVYYKKAALLAVMTSFLAVSAAPSFAAGQASLTRGGKLYDRWYRVINVDAPQSVHPAYPASGKKARDSWRCKECHGWDYKGKDGAYAKGSHFTGIKGVYGMKGADPTLIVALLKNETHGYGTLMQANDLQDLANFISEGLVDMSQYIDYKTKEPKGGDAAKGKVQYQSVCTYCHNANGTGPKEMQKTLGFQVRDNPMEVFHKVLNGQPAQPMPALRNNPAKARDVLTYLRTLPQKK